MLSVNFEIGPFFETLLMPTETQWIDSDEDTEIFLVLALLNNFENLV